MHGEPTLMASLVQATRAISSAQFRSWLRKRGKRERIHFVPSFLFILFVCFALLCFFPVLYLSVNVRLVCPNAKRGYAVTIG